MSKKTVLAIGRWMPIHLGHKQFLIDLAKKYDMLIVGIGSCFENGTPRNCIPAVEREQLLRTIFAKEGVTNFNIVHVADKPTFEDWFKDVSTLCTLHNITHFCTGNKEDILNVMTEKGLSLNAELINPEETSNFPYHATDIRNAILNNEFTKLNNMIPEEIKTAVLNQVAKEIKLVSEGKGQEFIPGRQTVDLAFIVHDRAKKERYLLIGKRNDEKIDFPGYYAIPGGGILDFESPVAAAVRCFAAETGLEIAVENNQSEPALVTVKNLNDKRGELHFTGIYASHDKSINGSQGGGSQCFAICIEENLENVTPFLNSTHDMVELIFVPLDEIYKIDFAYDQKQMVYNALNKLGIPYDKGELLQSFNENGSPSDQPVTRLTAHQKGILHGASHSYLYKWQGDELFILLQQRSLNKDSFPGGWDISSAGHMEYGSDFLKTAQKEIFEELGIAVPETDLEALFEQRIYKEDIFHDEDFIDNEINKIYALETDCDPKSLKFQPEEVAQAVWMSACDILTELRNDNPDFCMNKEEIVKVIEILTHR